MKKIIAFLLVAFMMFSVMPRFSLAEGETINEALNVEGGNLSFDASNWEVTTEDDRVCIVSTNHTDSSKARIKLIADIKEGDIVTFDAKVSSEYGYDGLLFSVDGEGKLAFSGEQDWENAYYIFEEEGTYILTWDYLKDDSYDEGEDCAWLDNIYLGANDFELEGIKVTEDLRVVKEGTKTIDVKPIPAFVELSEVTFTSENEEVATVDENGVVTGVELGETTITVTCGEFVEKTSVSVIDSLYANAFLLYDDSYENKAGLYSVELNTADQKLVTDLATIVGNEEDSIDAAEYYDGIVYAYTDMGYLLAIDAETLETKVLANIGMDTFIVDMAYDYKTATMYGIATIDESDERSLISIDLDNGDVTVIAELDFYAMTLAADDGVLYSIEYSYGTLYSIDVENGAEVKTVGETYTEPVYIQTMACNHETHELYWLAVCDTPDSYDCFIATVDMDTADIEVLHTFDYVTEYSGMYFEFEDTSEKIPVTGITLDKEEITLGWGDTEAILATVEPADASNKKVSWTSSDETIATVKNGVVKAIGKGEATITATTRDGGFTASCKVIVTNEPTYFLYEDFEDALEGWTIIDSDGDGYSWDMESPAEFEFDAYEGTGLIASASYLNDGGALTPDNWLISPAFTVSGSTSTLSWFAKGQDASWADENYSVYVLTDGTADSAIEVYNGVPTGNWAEYSVSLADYDGQEIQIAFRHYDVTDMFWLDLDFVTAYTLDEGEITPPAPDFTPADVNGDGAVNTGDAVMVLKYAAELIQLDDVQLLAANVNGDEDVNTGDAVVILKHIAGLVQIPGAPVAGDDTDSDVTDSDVTDSDVSGSDVSGSDVSGSDVIGSDNN